MPSTVTHPIPAPPEPDANWSAIARDLVELGGKPEALFSLPGMDSETAAEMAGLMAQHVAAGVTAILAPSKP